MIDRAPADQGQEWPPKGRIRYEVQAHIINAFELAPTSSNVVRIG